MESRPNDFQEVETFKNNNIISEDTMETINILKSQKRYEECITKLQQIIPILQQTFSKDSEEFYHLAFEISDICNLKAEELILQQKFTEAKKYLEKAIQIFSAYKPILNICYANLGKFHSRLGNKQKAIDNFKISLQISTGIGNKIHVAQGHLLMANAFLDMQQNVQAIEQALSGIILLQEVLISKEEKINNINILEALEDAYLIVAVAQYKIGNIIQSLLYCDLAEKLQVKIGIPKKEENSKTGEMNILEDSTKIELINKALLFDLEEDRALFDKNEKMAYGYMRHILKSMIKSIQVGNAKKMIPVSGNSISAEGKSGFNFLSNKINGMNKTSGSENASSINKIIGYDTKIPTKTSKEAFGKLFAFDDAK